MVRLAFSETKELEVTAQDLIKKVVGAKATNFSMLVPSNLRYLEKFYYTSGQSINEAYIAVVEHPPGLKKVSYYGVFDQLKSGEHNTKTAVVATPYLVQVFVILPYGSGSVGFDGSFVTSFWRNLPFSGLDDELYVCNLPNVRTDPQKDVGNNQAFCWTCYHNINGLTVSSDGDTLTGVLKMVRELSDYMWSSTFTNSAGATTAFYETGKKIPDVATFKQWAKLSKKNSNFGLLQNWEPHPEGWNLGQVLDVIRKHYKALSQEQLDKLATDTQLRLALTGNHNTTRF